MKIVSIFNNKGGVGKTTLTYHVAQALGEMGKKVLVVDLDPQCNITILALSMDRISEIWEPEDDFISDFDVARENDRGAFVDMLAQPRSVHFLLKPTEDGTAELDNLPPTISIGPNVGLLPGRLTLHLYEAKLAERWSGIYQGDPLSVRTATRLRALVHEYASRYKYDIVIFDTSPSLGALNRNILSLADGFIVPCSPDLFSLYGIRNIGGALAVWKKQFDSIFHFLSDEKRKNFPKSFVQFLGYTIYNAKKYGGANELNLAQAHYGYAKNIPHVIRNFIASDSRGIIGEEEIGRSIGNQAVIHSHNTLPSMAQKYHVAMWRVPDDPHLEPEDKPTVLGNARTYRDTRSAYHAFARDFLSRIEALDV
jgi:cellulose biosynthesis protein BcsQ